MPTRGIQNAVKTLQRFDLWIEDFNAFHTGRTQQTSIAPPEEQMIVWGRE